jgi:hypothetical protein
VPIICILAELIENGRTRARELVGRWAVSILVSGILVFPFILRTKYLSGEWLFLRSNTGYSVLMGNNPTASGTYSTPSGDYGRRFDEAAPPGPRGAGKRDRAALAWAARFWLDHPGDALRLTLRKVGFYVSPQEVPNNLSILYYRQISFLGWPFFLTAELLWPVAVLGLIVEWPRRRRWSLPVLFTISYSLLIISTFVVGRLRLPVVPFLMLWGAVALRWLYNEGHTLDRKRWAAVAGCIMAVLFFYRTPLERWLVPKFAPLGRPVDMENGLLFRDGDWKQHPRFPYRAKLETPDDQLIKEILLDPDDLAATEKAFVVIQGGYEGRGECVAHVNGHTKPLRFDEKPEGRFQEIRFQIPREWLEHNNRIGLQPRPGTQLFVLVDDEYWYGRSWISGKEGVFPGNRLDPNTCYFFRYGHLPRGELQIGILLVPR